MWTHRGPWKDSDTGGEETWEMPSLAPGMSGKLRVVALSHWPCNLRECSTCIEHLPLCEVFPHIVLEICSNLILSI